MSKGEGLEGWTVDSSRYVIDHKYLKLRVDSCTTPQGGKVDDYFVLECGDWVNCVAIDTDDMVITLKHYRHGVQKYVTEFVGGMVDAGMSPEEAIKQELEEEAGYTGGTLYHIGTGYPNAASHSNKLHTFLAVGGTTNREQTLEVGETIIVEKVPLPILIEQMSAPDAMYPSMHIAALFYTINFIRTSSDPAIVRLKQSI